MKRLASVLHNFIGGTANKNKKIIIYCSLALVIFAIIISMEVSTEVDDHVGEAKISFTQKQMKGEQYTDVVEDFESAGFINVQVEKLENLVTGWMTKEGEVEKVSVGAKEDFLSGDWVANDTAVVITYHAFPEKEESSGSASSESSESNIDNSSSESLDVPEKTDSLTISNCEDLKNLLVLKSTSDASITEFASKYKGRIVEFDGHIAHMDNHENAKTRYDILICAGDYRKTGLTGPYFKFEDVGAYDLGIKDLYLPDFVSANHNVKITAKIKEFNTSTEIFMLVPISIVDRETLPPVESKTKVSEEVPTAPSNLPGKTSEKVEPPVSQPKTSTAQDNERTVYWADTGTKIHTSARCRTIKGNVNSGTEANAIAAGRAEGYCKVCS